MRTGVLPLSAVDEAEGSIDPASATCGESAGPAIERLFRECYPVALAYAYRRVGHREQAEEIVGAALLRVFRDYARRRHADIPFRAYVYRVITNEIHAHFRARARYQRAIAGWLRGRCGTPRGQPNLDAQSDFERVRRALGDLPGKYAAVLALRYFEQMSTKEIAEILAIAESTVRTRLERGLKQLRTRLTEVERRGPTPEA